MRIPIFTKTFYMASLYLIPNVLAEGDWQNVLPANILPILSSTKFFIVENIRTARRFMKMVNSDIDIDSCTFFEINKYTDSKDLPGFLKPLIDGNDVAVISEAGCPGVADPGADVVRIAHQKDLKVVPIVGPSSILLALMASGLNGQNFAFKGYLPVKPNERSRELAILEKTIKSTRQTQIFIETPYRNNQLIGDILKSCSPETLLCIAANITGNNEFIQTKTVQQWKVKVPDLHKQPVIFLLG